MKICITEDEEIKQITYLQICNTFHVTTKKKNFKKYGNNYTPKLKVNSSGCIQPIFSQEAGLHYIVDVYVTVG